MQKTRHVVAHICDPGAWDLEAGDQKFKASAGYKASWRPSWAYEILSAKQQQKRGE